MALVHSAGYMDVSLLACRGSCIVETAEKKLELKVFSHFEYAHKTLFLNYYIYYIED